MTQVRVKLERADIVAALRARDGDVCMYPGCEEKLDFNATGRREVTLDHQYPVSKAREDGWSEEDIWSLDNLALMTKKCNASKGDQVLNPDGTLPDKKNRTFKYRRDKRLQRPEVCNQCNSGRNLQEYEWCNACGSGPMPLRYPKWRQLKPSECDHDLFYCVGCTVYFPEKRRSALDSLLTGGEGYE